MLINVPNFVMQAANDFVRAKFKLEQKVRAENHKGKLVMQFRDLPEWQPYEDALERWLNIAVLIAKP